MRAIPGPVLKIQYESKLLAMYPSCSRPALPLPLFVATLVRRLERSGLRHIVGTIDPNFSSISGSSSLELTNSNQAIQGT